MIDIFKYCKVQIALLFILFFIGYLYIKDGNRLSKKSKEKHCNRFFDWLFIFGELALLLDGLTAYTVNHLEQISTTVNMIVHLAYLLAYQGFIFLHLLYWLSSTDALPKKLWSKLFVYMPIVISAVLTSVFINKIDYQIGVYTNYSIGVPAVISYIAIGFYGLFTLVTFWIKRFYIQKNKRTAYIVALITVWLILAIQVVFNETLVSSIAVGIVIISIYLCMENPLIKFLEYYHSEMVMGFATLVENKDGSTGDHIRRSSAYAVLIAEELRKNPQYKSIITKDYILNLKKAAPMHDIGKIGIPDNILQKPGKLTNEEFETMKKHPEIGDKIIIETFGHLDDDDYENMASQVAYGHHEKWNGKGYPNHLQGTDIPLCARIMAVADVFDAVSMKRCYRDAMPLVVCYKIIKDGKGEDFDPDVVDAFFANLKKVEKIYYSV